MKFSAALAALVVLPVATAAGDWQPDAADDWQVRANDSLVQFLETEGETFHSVYENAYAFAVFPKVKRRSLLFGWASGRGVVVENGQFIGYTRQRRFSLGFQFGYQAQAQIVLFGDSETFDAWKQGTLEFTPQASANASGSGGAADAGFNPRVAVFSLTSSGLMLEAAAGATSYKFIPPP